MKVILAEWGARRPMQLQASMKPFWWILSQQEASDETHADLPWFSDTHTHTHDNPHLYQKPLNSELRLEAGRPLLNPITIWLPASAKAKRFSSLTDRHLGLLNLCKKADEHAVTSARYAAGSQTPTAGAAIIRWHNQEVWSKATALVLKAIKDHTNRRTWRNLTNWMNTFCFLN